ncbi:hypothetical protein HYPP_02645 [Hyphomicrobium sp. ghe19]|nr:hypothetical protein HYPP_02645 [Hyphomicrobium sp. ghe19]
MFELKDFTLGDAVELHPGCDRWMMGDRVGSVQKVGRKLLTVRMFTSGKAIKLHPANVGKLNGAYA